MRKFGLIGYPLGHSFSKKYFTQKFDNEGIKDSVYELYPIKEITDFPALIADIGPELIGMNVTIPYKQSIIPYLDDLAEDAAEIQAVNTIYFDPAGRRYGFNTDIPGFEESLKQFISEDVRTALVLGNGGAAKAVQYVLKKLQFEFFTVSRRPSSNTITYDQIDRERMNRTRLIINTTPLGMSPYENVTPDLCLDWLDSHQYLYDLVYNPSKTLFLAAGEKKGCKIQNGLDMLYRQAEASWNIWNRKCFLTSSWKEKVFT